MRMDISRAIVGWIYDHWVASLLMCLTVTVLSGALAAGVGVDNAVEIWFLDDDPTLAAYHDFQDTYGNDEVVALAVHDPDGVLDRAGLELIRRLGERAEGVEGIAEARSITTELTIEAGASLIDIDPLVPRDLDEVEDWEAQKQRILGDPLVRGTLVNEEGTTALVLARMEAMEGIDARRDGILAELEEATSDLPHRTAGIGVVYAALNQMATVDSAVFIGASYGLIILLLLLVYGRFTPMAVSMGVVGVGATWLMGAFGAAGRDINMVTMVLPTLVVIIGISDCVHILNHVAGAGGEDRRAKVVEGVSYMFWPCLFNTLTTVMAFMALVAAPMAVIRDMGLFAAVGLICAFVLAIVGCTVALRWEAAEPRSVDTGVLQRGVTALSELGIQKPRGVLAAAALLGLTAAVGVSRIEVDTYSIDFLFADHPVRMDSDAIERDFGPYMPLEVVVRSEQGVLRPDLFQAVDAWQSAAVEEVEHIGWASSVVDVSKRLNQAFSDGEQTSFRVPSTERAIVQGLEFYKTEGDLSALVADQERSMRVTFGMDMLSASGMQDTLEELLDLAEMPQDVTLVPSGYLPLYVQMMDYIVASQLSSFGLAFVVVFSLLAILFRSARVAALAVPANLVPVLLVLGVMGVAGVRLDVATVTIAAIVLGLVVDDTVQFLYRFRSELHSGLDHEEAVRSTVRSVGRSLAQTTIVLALGFSVLGLANVKSVVWFGLLIALALVFALLFDLIVMPALIVLTRPRL